MRRLATLDQEQKAQQWAAYLASQDVPIHLRREDDGDSQTQEWTLWVVDEDRVGVAKESLRKLQSGQITDFPSVRDSKLGEAEPSSRKRKRRSLRNPNRASTDPSRLSQQNANFSDRSSINQAGPVRTQVRTPATIVAIVASVVLSLATNFGLPETDRQYIPGIDGESTYKALSFVTREDFAISGDDPLANIRTGEVWRLITPFFLHGSGMHLAFNMIFLFQLGTVIERLHGTIFLIGMLVVTAVAGALVQSFIPPLDWLPKSLHGTPFAIGASGAVYGLFGFLVTRPQVDATYPIRIDGRNVVLLVAMMVACMTPLVPNVANGAHVGGFVSGLLIGSIAFIGRHRRVRAF